MNNQVLTIKKTLKIKGINYEELSRLSGISKSTIMKILSGHTQNPRLDTIQALTQALDLVQPIDLYPSEPILRYPIIGTIRAGYGGVPLEEFTDDWQEVPASIIKGHKKEDFFVLEIVGNSMYPRFLEGDRVLVKRCASVDSGDIAVFIYDGNEATVKKVHYVPGEDWMEFIPYNPEYPTKRIAGPALQETWVLGKVVYMFRKV